MATPPGPGYSPLIQTLLYFAQPDAFLRGLHQRYGDVFAVNTVMFGPEVCVVRPEAIKQVFTGDPENFRAGEANVALEPVVGQNSELLLDGAEHARQRRLMLPSFHGERMRAYAKTMLAITEEVIGRWPMERPFALHPHMQRLTLAVILRTIFGVEDGAVGSGPLGDALAALLDGLSSPLLAIGTLPPLRKELFGLSPWAAFRRLRDRVDRAIYGEITRRRAARASAATAKDDVLSILLEAVDDSGRAMTDRELRDELVTLLAAGHETTATELCWAFELILRTPRVLDRLTAELRDAGGEPDVERLPYLDATIKEVLRLRPVIPAVGRRVKKALTIGGYDVPTGTLLVPSVWLTHRLPDIYPDPEELRPERFLGVKPDPYAWLPFGGGPRRCLGMAFALYEMKIVLATVLGRVRLRLERERPARIVIRGFTHAPAGGVRVIAGRG